MSARGWLRGDYCLTPLGRRAKVVRNMPDGKVEVSYLGRNERLVIDPKLLLSWKPEAYGK